MIDPDTLVAISVSAPADDELAARGLSGLHVRYVFTELVRHVLAAGGAIAYGGALDDVGDTQPNFTRIMLDMVSAYRPDLRPSDDRLVDFAASALWQAADGSVRPEFEALVRPYAGRFQVERCSAELRRPVPAEVTSTEAAAPSRTALSFTAMREQMAQQCAARVIVGGRLQDYRGRYPGVIEEAILTAAEGQALFVVGGFAGAAGALARHLAGAEVPELAQQWQIAGTPATAGLAAGLADTAYRLDLDADLARVLPRGDWAALHNGLSPGENERLAVTTDVDEVVSLVLRGLHAVAGR